MVFFSGTWNFFPKTVISTSRSYGRKTCVVPVDAAVSIACDPVCFDMRGLSPSSKTMTRGYMATMKMLACGANPAMVYGRLEKGGSFVAPASRRRFFQSLYGAKTPAPQNAKREIRSERPRRTAPCGGISRSGDRGVQRSGCAKDRGAHRPERCLEMRQKLRDRDARRLRARE